MKQVKKLVACEVNRKTILFVLWCLAIYLTVSFILSAFPSLDISSQFRESISDGWILLLVVVYYKRRKIGAGLQRFMRLLLRRALVLVVILFGKNKKQSV